MTTHHIRYGSLTAIYASSASYPCGIGTKWEDETTGKVYRFVYNSGATSWTIGVPVGMFLTATSYGLCSFTAATQLLIYDGGTAVTAVAGIALGTVATTEAGWIQVGGMCSNIQTDTNVDASDGLYVADNGIVALPVTEPTNYGVFGVANAADSSTTLSYGLLFNCVLR